MEQTGVNIQEALNALRELEKQRPGTTAQLILYTNGDGAVVLQDWFGKFRAAVDFERDANLLEVVRQLGESENMLEV